MAVAFSTHVAETATTSANPTVNITVSGSNPVLVLNVALSSATDTVSSVTWSLGSGAATEVKNARSGTAFASSWQIPAPAGGAGTATINLSASVPHQIDVGLFTGADQTIPCPAADAVTSIAAGSETLTPASLTASDASNGMEVNTIAGNPTGVTPNQRYLDATTVVNLETGDATGTTGVTLNNDGNVGASWAKVAIRIKAAGVIPSTGAYQQEQSSTDRYQLEDGSGVYLIEPWGQTGVFLPPFIQGDLTGIGIPGRFFKDRLG